MNIAISKVEGDTVRNLDVPAGWQMMASGKGVDIGCPIHSAIDWNDIAIALSLTCRYGGAMRDVNTFYSVAQHSCLVADLLHPEIAVYGLLHDAHEAYLQDDITPKKRLMAAAVPEAAAWLENLKAQWDVAIWRAAHVKRPSASVVKAVRDADYMALSIEKHSLLNPPADATTRASWAGLPDTSGYGVLPLPAPQAYGMFMQRLNALLWPSTQEGSA